MYHVHKVNALKKKNVLTQNTFQNIVLRILFGYSKLIYIYAINIYLFSQSYKIHNIMCIMVYKKVKAKKTENIALAQILTTVGCTLFRSLQYKLTNKNVLTTKFLHILNSSNSSDIL